MECDVFRTFIERSDQCRKFGQDSSSEFNEFSMKIEEDIVLDWQRHLMNMLVKCRELSKKRPFLKVFLDLRKLSNFIITVMLLMLL